MIRAIIFDCFGVLTTDKWKEFVATLSVDQVQPAIDLNHALDRGFISQTEFFEQISDLTGRSPEHIESVINADMHKNIQLMHYIKVLKKTYKIGLISNVSSNWVRDTFLSPEEAALFDDIILSYDVGLIKPEKAIYELSARRLKCDVQECLFIDDSEGHCVGAIQAGMQSFMYKDFIQCKSSIEQITAISQ